MDKRDIVKYINGKKAYLCPYCGKTIFTRKGFKHHIGLHIKNGELSESEGREILEISKDKRGRKPQVKEVIKPVEETPTEIIAPTEQVKKTENIDIGGNGEVKKEPPKEIKTGIEEAPMDFENVEKLKEQLINIAEEGEEGKATEQEEGETTEGEEITEAMPEISEMIELSEEDIADLYLNLFSFLGMVWGIDLYEDKGFINRATRRARLLHKILSKYVGDNDNIAIVILVSDVISDVFYVRKIAGKPLLPSFKEGEKS